MKNKVVFFYIGFIAIYFVIDLFFTDAPVYIVGGIIGSMAGSGTTINLFILYWLLALILLCSLYFFTSHKFLKYILLILIVPTLYIFDLLVYEVFKSKEGLKISNLLSFFLRLSVRSLILFGIIFFLNKKRTKIYKA